MSLFLTFLLLTDICFKNQSPRLNFQASVQDFYISISARRKSSFSRAHFVTSKHIFSRATLNETFTAKYDKVLPRTSQMRPKSEIYTPKRDDEHPHPFHMRSFPPGLILMNNKKHSILCSCGRNGSRKTENAQTTRVKNVDQCFGF